MDTFTFELLSWTAMFLIGGKILLWISAFKLMNKPEYRPKFITFDVKPYFVTGLIFSVAGYFGLLADNGFSMDAFVFGTALTMLPLAAIMYYRVQYRKS